MTNNRFLLCLCLISLFCFTCNPEDSITFDSEFGAIYITVRQNNSSVDGALLITDPESSLSFTDFSGAAILKDLEPGTYQITAAHPEFGTGTAVVVVNKGQISDVDIDLIEGVFIGPRVNFISPTNGSVLDLSASFLFSITVFDNEDSSEDINLEWTSNIDGLLSMERATVDGVANIMVDNLSEGEHEIQVKAIDSDGFVGGAIARVTVTELPNSVVLSPAEGISNGVQLNWTVSDEPDFLNYTIYRSTDNSYSFQALSTINDKNTTTFIDNSVTIGETYYYKIGVSLSSLEEGFSNVQFLFYEGVSIIVGTDIEKMIVDPDRPYLYALDKGNNSLLFIDLELSNVTKTIFVGLSPTDLDISLDGQKLYIANFGSNEISVVDLETQELDFNFLVDTEVGTWDGNPYRIATLSNNRLAFTSEDQWNSVKVVDGTTGSLIDVSGNVYEPNLFTNLTGDVLYVAENGGQVIQFSISGNTLQEVDESSNISSFRRSSLITGNGEYIFYGKKKILASNLQVILGSFPDEIYAASSQGAIALGEERYFDALNFTTLGNLPVSSRIMAAKHNENIFYIYNLESRNIVVFDPN